MKEIDELEIIKSAKEAEKIMLAHFDKGSREDYIFTEAFEVKMNKLIKNQRNSFSSRLVKKIGVVILVVSLVGTVSIGVEAARIKIIEVVTEIFEKFTSISLQVPEDGKYSEETQETYCPEYIPEGFYVIDQEEIFNDIHITYQNSIGEEILFRRIEVSANNLVIDTEDTVLEKLILDNREFYYYENKGIKNIIWMQGGYQISISSGVSKEELVKISLSVK